MGYVVPQTQTEHLLCKLRRPATGASSTEHLPHVAAIPERLERCTSPDGYQHLGRHCQDILLSQAPRLKAEIQRRRLQETQGTDARRYCATWWEEYEGKA